MTDTVRDTVKRALPWVATVALIGLAAFALGRCTGGGGEADEEAEAPEVVEDWTCAMHSQIHRPEPGSCPICGMDLVLVGSSGEELGAGQVALGERARVLARIRTEAVRAGSSTSGELRLSGRVEIDETTQRTVTAWIGGRIDRLHVRVTGQTVRRGQTIATLYSPEVYAAQRDLTIAARQVERLSGASELARSAAEATLSSTRERLRLLGIPEAEVARMERAESPSRRISIRSPFAGTVLERIASEGSYVTAGAPLFRIADLSRLWVQLDAFESDLPRLAVGQSVELVVDARPGVTLEGRVAFVDPVIDARRRTARVRIEVRSPDGELRPGMFVEAVVQGEADASSPLTIPASAPLFTGRRSLVYVEVRDRAQPTYEARTVRLGPRVGHRYAVLEGLEAGERVVIEGAFALDADLQIRGGASMMTRDPAPDVETAVFEAVVEAYLDLQRALANDDLDDARTAAERLAVATAGEDALAARLATHARAVGSATDLAAARAPFEPLSNALTRLLRSLGNPTEQAIRLAFCPMAFEGRGAEWIQASDTINNAYFGDAMLTCGSFRETFPAAPAVAEESEDEEGAQGESGTSTGTGARRRRVRRAPAQAPVEQAPVDHSGHEGHVH